MIHSAKLQLVNLVLKMGFPEECLAPVEFNVDSRDRNLDIMTAMLAAGLYPNICIHHEKRLGDFVICSEFRKVLSMPVFAKFSWNYRQIL